MEKILRQTLCIPRPIRFLIVGGVCTALQWILLISFVEVSLEKHLSNAVGFVLSAQVNFFLTYHITHGDRKGDGVLRKLVQFNLLAITILASNMLVFSIVLNMLSTPYIIAGIASAGGTLMGMAINYFVGLNHIFIPTNNVKTLNSLQEEGEV